jgi:Cof subfamily protein (haloacid dehalogenase superfamily)
MNAPGSENVDKLIAVDLDGTLLGPDNSVSAENVAAIRRAGRRGAVVVIVTGRPHRSADAIAQRLELPPSPLVSFNGALIRWSGGGPSLYRCALPPQVAAEVVDECVREQLHLHYYLDDQLYVSRDNDRARRYCQRIAIDGIEERDMRRFAGQEPLKLLVVDEPENIPGLWERYGARWAGRVYVTRSMAEYLEFLSPDVSKGRALDWLLEFYGVCRERALAIGDSMNDLPLLTHAGQAVAMPDADLELKQLAHFIPPEPSTAVAAAIDWFLIRS